MMHGTCVLGELLRFVACQPNIVPVTGKLYLRSSYHDEKE